MIYCKNKNYKEYPQHRVCVIDYYPVITGALATAFKECKKLGITSRHWSLHSRDISNFLFHYCIEGLCEEYTLCPSKLRKVYAVYINNQTSIADRFLKNHIKTLMKVCPVPWCNVRGFDDPDVEYAALRAVERSNTSLHKLLKFTKKHSLRALESKFKKNQVYLNSSVDLSHSH